MNSQKTSTVDVDLIIKIIIAVITYGAPAVSELIAHFKDDKASDPTAEDVHALLDGLKPPEGY